MAGIISLGYEAMRRKIIKRIAKSDFEITENNERFACYFCNHSLENEAAKFEFEENPVTTILYLDLSCLNKFLVLRK